MSLKKNATRREDYIKMSASILACPHGYLRIARGFMGFYGHGEVAER